MSAFFFRWLLLARTLQRHLCCAAHFCRLKKVKHGNDEKLLMPRTILSASLPLRSACSISISDTCCEHSGIWPRSFFDSTQLLHLGRRYDAFGNCGRADIHHLSRRGRALKSFLGPARALRLTGDHLGQRNHVNETSLGYPVPFAASIGASSVSKSVDLRHFRTPPPGGIRPNRREYAKPRIPI